MSKRLILILALAFAVGVTAVAFAEVQNVKVSGDITAYGIYRDLSLRGHNGPSYLDLDGSGNSADTYGENGENIESALASIVNIRIDADLTDNVSTTVKLINERYWGDETVNGGGADGGTDIGLSLAYVTMKEFLYSPLTLTVGRQELHFGNDMIIGDPDTNGAVDVASAFFGGGLLDGRDADLSARKGFDAIRANFNYDPLVIDVVYAKIAENNPERGDDMNLVGFNANYKLPKIELGKLCTLANSVAELYFWDVNIGRDAFLNAQNLRVDVVGGRFVTSPIENLVAQIETAYQFGRINNDLNPGFPPMGIPDVQRQKAWALETALSYNWSKAKYTPSLTGMYAFFSGSKDREQLGNRRTAGWIPMFENQKFGDIANALIPQSDAHIVGVVGTMKPMQDIILKGEYYAYWWEKGFSQGTAIQTLRGNSLRMTNESFAGQELDLTTTYNYTEDVQFNLLGAWFYPGASFDKVNKQHAAEIIGSMKVTF